MTIPGEQDRPLPQMDPSASIRDHLANERTLLAYLRTSMAVFLAGLLIERYSLLERFLAAVNEETVTTVAVSIVGTILMWLGFLLIPVSVWRFLVERHHIGEPFPRAAVWPAVLLAITLALASIALLFAILGERLALI